MTVHSTDGCIAIDYTELLRILRFGRAEEELSAFARPPLVVIDLDNVPDDGHADWLLARSRGVACIFVGVLSRDPPEHARRIVPLLCDVVLVGPSVRRTPDPDWAVRVPDLDAATQQLTASVASHPLAAITFALLLRRERTGSIDEELAAESAAYSTLQAGPEFTAWLRARKARPPRPTTGPVVVACREAETLHIRLNAPHVHNAFSLRMRDELCDALALADADTSLRRIVIQGQGPSFCSGGYLDEFGTLPDPATAHVVRLVRSAGRLLARLSERVEVRLHGAAMGAGIELAAFARHVVADPATRIALPELALGLLPGAGGTVSLPRRVGRHRTVYLGLSGTAIASTTALDWGLIDEIRPRADWQPGRGHAAS